jgi:L-asparaginase II
MKILPPLEVEITRGNRVESRHLVDAVIADASGALVRVHGEAARPVFPRSAIKALQALALVESGAADRFGLEPRHIALACASHNGEEMHVRTAADMLARAGLVAVCLECGAQPPSLKEDYDRMIRAGEKPQAIHNNCSGKHSGFLCFAAHEGFETKGYVKFAHPVQRAIASIMTETTGASHGEDNCGIDGCSIPTYAIALENLAVAFAKFGVGDGGGPLRSKAMLRIRDACLAHPEMVHGTGGFDTDVMRALGGRVFTKTGAEGVFIASVPELGLGIALKVHDGAKRASEAAMAALIESALELEEPARNILTRFSNHEIRNWNSLAVGRVVAAT